MQRAKIEPKQQAHQRTFGANEEAKETFGATITPELLKLFEIAFISKMRPKSCHGTETLFIGGKH